MFYPGNGVRRACRHASTTSTRPRLSDARPRCLGSKRPSAREAASSRRPARPSRPRAVRVAPPRSVRGRPADGRRADARLSRWSSVRVHWARPLERPRPRDDSPVRGAARLQHEALRNLRPGWSPLHPAPGRLPQSGRRRSGSSSTSSRTPDQAGAAREELAEALGRATARGGFDRERLGDMATRYGTKRTQALIRRALQGSAH